MTSTSVRSILSRPARDGAPRRGSRPPGPTPDSEIEPDDLGVSQEGLPGSLQTVLPLLEHVAVVGHGEALAGLLLDHQDGHAGGVGPSHPRADPLQDGPRPAGPRLVEDG